jgi:hypothetical protein
MSWTYSEQFDLAFSAKFEDPILRKIAVEFFEIQKDFEENAYSNGGKLDKRNYLKLKKLSEQLRENSAPPQTENSKND